MCDCGTDTSGKGVVSLVVDVYSRPDNRVR